MSLLALNWAFEQDVAGPEKAVLLALAHCHNGKSQKCCPTIGHIQKLSGVGRRTVQRALRTLEGKKLIIVGYSGGRKSHCFQLATVSESHGSNDPNRVRESRNRVRETPQPCQSDTQNMEVNMEEHGRGANGSRRKRDTSPPEVFKITPNLEAWANQKHITVNLENETEKFLDHHRAKGTTFKDWQAAWRNWMLKAQEYAQQRQPAEPVATPPRRKLN